MSGGGKTQLFTVADGASLTLFAIIVADGFADMGDCGGAISISMFGHLLAVDATMTRNVGDSGGAVCNKGTFEAYSVSFTNNKAEGMIKQGGAIHNSGSMTLVANTFKANDAQDGGAAPTTRRA